MDIVGGTMQEYAEGKVPWMERVKKARKILKEGLGEELLGNLTMNWDMDEETAHKVVEAELKIDQGLFTIDEDGVMHLSKEAPKSKAVSSTTP